MFILKNISGHNNIWGVLKKFGGNKGEPAIFRKRGAGYSFLVTRPKESPVV